MAPKAGSHRHDSVRHRLKTGNKTPSEERGKTKVTKGVINRGETANGE